MENINDYKDQMTNSMIKTVDDIIIPKYGELFNEIEMHYVGLQNRRYKTLCIITKEGRKLIINKSGGIGGLTGTIGLQSI